jgi:hypothetical protein
MSNIKEKNNSFSDENDEMNDEKKRKREACSSVSSTLDTSTGKRN